MSLEPNIIRYTFDLGNHELIFNIDTSETISEIAGVSAPDWTRLNKNQCACCPLKTDEHSHCPAALQIHQVIETFKNSASVERVELTVETERRTYKQKCDLQSGLNSMLGLQMAISGCPVIGRLRAMATFHMPFCSFEETLYRSVGSYLTKQYFVYKKGGEPDWNMKGLQAFYEELEELNNSFSKRVRDLGQNDAISNAIVMFFAASILVASSIEDSLEEYKDYLTGSCVDPTRDD